MDNNKEANISNEKSHRSNVPIIITTIAIPIIYIITVFIGSIIIYRLPDNQTLEPYLVGYKVQFFGQNVFFILLALDILLAFLLKAKHKALYIIINFVILNILLFFTNILNSWA
jgi:hypothetical protein